jgi:hypothetical protein
MRRTLTFVLCILAVVTTGAQSYPAMGGAQIEEPFKRSITGAVCFTGTGKLEGNSYFNFPTQDKKALSFIIGPSGPGQEKNDRFKGPGTYSNIGIFIQPEEGDGLFGYGEVVVHDDSRTGTFRFKVKDDDNDENSSAASGTWDCGRGLKH